MSTEVSPRTSLRVLVVALTLAALYACWPLWPALVLAAWTATILRPLLTRIERVLPGRRRAAGMLSLLLFVLLALPLAAVVLAVISGGQDLIRAIQESSSARTAVVSLASAPSGAPTLQLPKNLGEALEFVRRYGAQGLGVLSNVAGAAGTGLVAVFIYFAGAYELLVEGPRAWAWCKLYSPLPAAQLERFAGAFQQTGRGLLVGVGLTTVTQGLVATLVYVALGVPRWWVLGPITGLVSVVPFVGSALVWVPISAGLVVSGHPIKGGILVVLGVAVIGVIDNLLRPIFARYGSLELNTFLLFVALFGGIATFGAWGALLGPLIVRLWIEAVAMRRESELSDRPEAHTINDGARSPDRATT
ncbi:MAG: AI-2E family transporter [Myxococcales bacterium]|nr:AI-2E family transporter [Myxococcales bacterium]